MGVAVITSTSGLSPLPRSVARWATPKRCCSSTTARPSRRKRTPSWTRAWVPTTQPTAPSAVAAISAARALPFTALVSSATSHPERPEQSAQRQQMLLREDLGRRHERRLIARFDRRQHRQRGHDRLARADIPLEQAIHRVRLRHVRPDLAPHPLLGTGERERQGFAQPPGQDALRIHAEAPLAALALSADGEAELEQEEVVEDEAPASRFLLGGRLGKVTGLERRRDVEEAAPPANSLREGLLDEVAVSVEESLDEGSQRALREPLGEAIDRNEAAGVKIVVLPFLRDLVVLRLDLQQSAARRATLPWTISRWPRWNTRSR